MTRMERRRRRARRRRLQILVVALVIASFIMICNAFVAGADQEELRRVTEARQQVTNMEHRGGATFGHFRAATPTTMELVHTIPASDGFATIVENVSVSKEPEPKYQKLYTERDVIAMAQMAYGEGWITQSDTEMSWSMWCACNRFDSGDPFYRDCDSIYDIITQERQFHGYDSNNPVEERLVNLARDVLDRWSAEKQGATDVGRTLPAEYLFFWGDGLHNHFTTEWQGGIEYDGHLGTPYEN